MPEATNKPMNLTENKWDEENHPNQISDVHSVVSSTKDTSSIIICNSNNSKKSKKVTKKQVPSKPTD